MPFDGVPSLQGRGNWVNAIQIHKLLLAVLDLVNTWTVEEVLLCSRLDDEVILRCDYELNKLQRVIYLQY